MSARAGVTTSPPGGAMTASSVGSPGSRNRLEGQVCLTSGQLIGPPTPMVAAVIAADARDMSDPRKVFGTRCAANLGVVALASLLMGIAACGDGGDNEPTAPEAASATPRAVGADLGRYLMRRGEEPGFRPGAAAGATGPERETVTGVKAFVDGMNLPAADERRLRSEGFISFTSQPITGPESAGVTNVALYETAQGSKRSLAHELRPDVIRAAGPVTHLRFFRVPGIPGARGWTGSLPGEPASRAVGNVFWVQGRCMHVLGNQGPGRLAPALSRGARAIYERTSEQCPCAK